MDRLVDVIRVAKAYAKMGSAIQEQLDDLLDNAEEADVTIGAFEYIKEFLAEVSDLDEDCAEAVQDLQGLLEEVRPEFAGGRYSHQPFIGLEQSME